MTVIILIFIDDGLDMGFEENREIKGVFKALGLSDWENHGMGKTEGCTRISLSNIPVIRIQLHDACICHSLMVRTWVSNVTSMNLSFLI